RCQARGVETRIEQSRILECSDACRYYEHSDLLEEPARSESLTIPDGPRRVRSAGSSRRDEENSKLPAGVKLILRLFATVHGVMAVLFACAALLLIAIATREAWVASVAGLDHTAAQAIIEAVGLLAAAVVALQIAQTIAEEEVVRGAHISAPTRV